MGLFDWFRATPQRTEPSDQAFAALLVGHALSAAEECMNRFLYEDNCEREEDGLLMYENLFTIYLALVFAYLREFDMRQYEDLIVNDLRRRFQGAGSAQTNLTVANIYHVRDHVHPPSRSHSFEELKSSWPLFIRAILEDYHRARFGKRTFLAIVDEGKTANFLAEHVERVEAQCKNRAGRQ